MTDKPTEPDNQQQECSQQVQDYLDMLLCPAGAEQQEQSELESQPAEQEAPALITPAISKGAPALTMVGGTAVSSLRPQRQQRPVAPAEEDLKPFAEPTRPVTLRMPVVEVKPAPVETAEPPQTATEAREAPPATPTPTPAVETPIETPAPEPQAVEAETVEHQTSVWMDNGRPAWAQSRFECLLFSVGGLTLAVPLVELGTIYPINDEITPIFGQIDWFLGLLSVKDRNIKAVNTARIVMPERYREQMLDHYEYLITINGVEWGLAVDSVSSAITLEPGDVRWRTERSKRPWLAGTVVDHMCALLDVSQLAAMFIEANRRKTPH